MRKLNPQVKIMWVAALRSGNYQQELGDLKTENGFSCYGVLTDLYVRTHFNARWAKQWSEIDIIRGVFDPDDDWMPSLVASWAGIEQRPQVQVDGDFYYLDELNDSDWSFEKLADLIEEKL